MKVSAIIPAAGQGVRMGAGVPKQFLRLNGTPILHHTLHAFEQCTDVDAVVLVVPPEELEAVRESAAELPPIVKQIVVGGKQRQDSVYNGFKALETGTDIVIVHDGVRPFVSVGLVQESIQAARDFGAVITAIPVCDTIKKSNPDGFVERTLDREHLWRVQTPQSFRYDVLKEALEKAGTDGYYGTDEGSLIEYLGREVKIIPGSEWNIKITRAEDLELGEKILSLMRED